MDSSDETDTVADHFATSLSHSTSARRRRHKRLSSVTFSTDTLPSLPEYQAHRSPPPALPSTPTTPPGLWHHPPPNYPGSSSVQGSDADEERDSVPIPIRRKPRRRRSYSGSEDALDILLQRSVAALETSNALLQASMTTHSSLTMILSDPTFDRTVEAQLKFVENRFNASQKQHDRMDEVLQLMAAQDVVMSKSLPSEGSTSQLRERMDRAESHQKRLQLSTDQRPISPPPKPITQYVDSYASESTSDHPILLPSTLGTKSHSRVCSVSSPSPHIPPAVPLTPPAISKSAVSLLSSIQSRSSSPATDKHVSHSRSASFMGSPFTPSFNNNDIVQPHMGTLIHSSSSNSFASPPPLLRTWLSQSSEQSPFTPIWTPRDPVDLASPPPTSTAVEYSNAAAFKTVESLRKILADATPSIQQPLSDTATGKQRADGERPPLRRSKSTQFKSFQPITRASLSPPTAYLAQDSTSELELPQPIEPIHHVLLPTLTLSTSSPSTSSPAPTLRRSALKCSSSRGSPVSSGRSTPRAVSFADLPPKHQPDASSRRIERRKSRKPRVAQKQGWLEWMLNAAVETPRGRHQASGLRPGGLMREDTRWQQGGGLDSWQV